MKQSFKKLGFFILTLALVFSFSCGISTKAAQEGYREIDEAVTSYVYSNMQASTQHIETINNGNTDPKNANYYWNPHTVHWVDFDTSSEVKVVTYSGSNADKWKQLTTRQAAADWEKNNPGWIVLAGINGDFFENSGKTTYQPTNNFMQNGDMYRPEKSSATNRFNIGWNEDGSVIIGDPSVSSDIYLRVYNDEKTEIENNVAIKTVNKTPSATGISLLTKDSANAYDLTGFKVYDCTYEICRLSSGGSVFVKGTVGDVVELGASSKPANGHFYLISKDGSLDNVITKGDYIKCEYVYEGQWANVQNSVGYIDQVLKDGVPQHRESKDAFAYTSHPRTVIGFKPDGSTVFMVFEGRGLAADYQVGCSHYESGQILLEKGCVNGFNLDGGGSSTLIVRNEQGGFTVMNDPSDGSERADGNHCLVVMRDPGFVVNSTESKYDKAVVDLRVTNQEYFSTLSNIKVTLNGVTKDYTNSPIEFTNVEMDTKYDLSISYDSPDTYDDTKTSNKTYRTYLTTPEYEFPDPGFKFVGKTGNSITVAKDMTLSTANQIVDVIVHVGKETFNMGSAESFVCNGLYKDVEYDIYFEYKVVAPNGTKYPAESKHYTVKTLAYSVPSIASFAEGRKSNSSLTLAYEYIDEDRIAETAYVLVNGEKSKEVSTRSGNVTITGLDFENNSYEFQLVVEFLDEDQKLVQVKSDILEYTLAEPEPTPEPEKPKGGCGNKGAELIISLMAATAVVGIFLRKRK